MKSNSSVKFLIPALGAVAFVWIGCQSKLAPLTTANTNHPTYPIMIFTSPTSVEINPSLPVGSFSSPVTNGPQNCYSCPVDVWSYPVDIISYQPATISMTPCLGSYSSPCTVTPTGDTWDVEPSGMSANPYCVHVTGWINDPESPLFIPGPGNYDSAYLRAWPNFNNLNPSYNNGTYDISIFQGVQFYVNVTPIDNAPSRQFVAYTLQAQTGPGPAPVGFCQNPNDPALAHCFDPFYYDYTDIRKGEWVFVQKRWEDLHQFGNGSTPNPPTFSGVNLQQFLFFGWQEGNSAQAGPVTLDFSVTGVSFF